MNSKRSVHSIPGLPHCLIDGFRLLLEDQIPHPADRIYFLTHYHSDHYGGLWSGWDQGRIICSPTTASLITSILRVKMELVTSVGIGDSVEIPGAKVTLLDANHCPGAAMLLFHVHATGLVYLHTGDMRYHPRMKLYKELSRAKIDRLYLDTTYAHPKHVFLSQDEAIAQVVEQCRQFFHKHGDEGIVYIGAYNLGKERVIFAVSDALQLPVYMDEKKVKIILQIEGGPERVSSGKITTDVVKARIHVCAMNFAGSVSSYFRPNFSNIMSSLRDLNDTWARAGATTKRLKRALAFIPTGWAASSNYNKRNSYIEYEEIGAEGAEGAAVQILPYSEHSHFAELIEFTQFLKPREVVPTVYEDEKTRLFMLDLFNKYTDQSLNMRNFIQKLSSPSATDVTANQVATSNGSMLLDRGVEEKNCTDGDSASHNTNTMMKKKRLTALDFTDSSSLQCDVCSFINDLTDQKLCAICSRPWATNW